MIARESLEKSLPRLASAAPFLCLIDDHLLCPDISPSWTSWACGRRSRLPPSPGAAGGRMLRSRRSNVFRDTPFAPLACLLCQRRPRRPRTLLLLYELEKTLVNARV